MRLLSASRTSGLPSSHECRVLLCGCTFPFHSCLVRFRFAYAAEYVTEETGIFFREGRTKGVGRVVQLLVSPDTPTASPFALEGCTTNADDDGDGATDSDSDGSSVDSQCSSDDGLLGGFLALQQMALDSDDDSGTDDETPDGASTAVEFALPPTLPPTTVPTPSVASAPNVDAPHAPSDAPSARAVARQARKQARKKARKARLRLQRAEARARNGARAAPT